jgi:hypothetical protein
MRRDITSNVFPGGKGMMILIGRWGQACAHARVAGSKLEAAMPAMRARRDGFMRVSWVVA